ncbi:trigger factor, partial [Porticoccus sp.]
MLASVSALKISFFRLIYKEALKVLRGFFMQVSVETTSGLERRVTIQVPAAQIDEAVEERLKQTAKSARINGFRRGKVPMSFVRRQYGNEVRAEVVSEVMRTK